MSRVYRIDGELYTAPQIATLCQLVKKPRGLSELDGIAMKPYRILSKRGDILLDEHNEVATITDKGRAVVVNVNERVNGKGEPKPKRNYTRRAVKAAAPAKHNGHGALDLAQLREQIVARYEADLAAVTRLEEIAAHLGGGA